MLHEKGLKCVEPRAQKRAEKTLQWNFCCSCRKNLITKTASWHPIFGVAPNWYAVPCRFNAFCSLVFMKMQTTFETTSINTILLQLLGLSRSPFFGRTFNGDLNHSGYSKFSSESYNSMNSKSLRLLLLFSAFNAFGETPFSPLTM